MKKVFENSMVAHVWAQQTQEEGRSHNGNFFFHDKTIYSYRHSFPLATFYKGHILLNTSSYSVSTSQHQSYIRQAINSDRDKILNVDTTTLCRIVEDHIESALKSCLEHTRYEVKQRITQAMKRRKETLKIADLNQATYLIKDAKTLFEVLEHPKKFPKDLEKLLSTLQDDVENVFKEHAVLIDKEEKAKKRKENKERKIKLAMQKEEIEKFRAGEHFGMHALHYGNSNALLRIKNDTEIETSQGAVFPIAHCEKAFQWISLLRKEKRTWSACNQGQTIRLGNFKIDHIYPTGNIKAGCHTVEYKEILNLAKQLNLV